MKVYVVMGNDYPDAVFDDEAEAERYCERRRAEPRSTHADGHVRIYWRVYSFPLRSRA